MSIKAWWNRRRRAIDLRILAPDIRRAAPSAEAAKAVVLRHANDDPAWRDASESDVQKFIDASSSGLPTRVEAAIVKARGGPTPDYQFTGYS